MPATVDSSGITPETSLVRCMRWMTFAMCIVAALALGFGVGWASCRSRTMLRQWPADGRSAHPIEAADLRSCGAVGGSCIFHDEQAVVVLDRSGELRQHHLDLAATVAMTALLNAKIDSLREKFLGKSAAELDRPDLPNTVHLRAKVEHVERGGSGGGDEAAGPGGGGEESR